MIYLFLALLSSVFVSIVIKYFGKFNINNFQAITFNYVISLGVSVLLYKGNSLNTGIINETWFYYAMIIGCGFILMFNLYAFSVKKIGIALSTVSSKMSVIIPVYSGILLFNDSFNINKIIGFLLTLLAFYLIFKKEKDIPFRKEYFWLPLLLFTTNGFNDTMQNYSQKTFLSNNNSVLLFMIIIFGIALLIGSLIIIFKLFYNKEKIQNKNIIAGFTLGLFNFFGTFFFIKAISAYQSTFIFPVFNVSLVSLTALVGYFFFKEKLRPVNWFGLLAACLAITIIALG